MVSVFQIFNDQVHNNLLIGNVELVSRYQRPVGLFRQVHQELQALLLLGDLFEMHDEVLLALLLQVLAIELQAIQVEGCAVVWLQDLLNDNTLNVLLE